MAFRAAMKRCKTWSWAWSYHHHLSKGSFGIVGAGSATASMAAHNFLSFNNRQTAVPRNQSCRHYYLPRPPQIEVIDGYVSAGSITDVDNLDNVLSSAQFAVMMLNGIEGRNIRFKRIIRAHQMRVAGNLFYLTLEGIDENGKLNVYYAEVYDCIFEKLKQLYEWQLLDDSFSYPYRVSRTIEEIETDILRAVIGCGIHEYSIAGLCKGNDDLPGETMNFEENEIRTTESFSPFSNGDIGVVGISDTVPINNKIIHINVIHYALSALEEYNKKGKEIRLSELLHANVECIDGKVFYILFLKAVNGENNFKFYYALLEVSQTKEELIKCHMIDELFWPSKKNQIVLGA